MLDPSVRLFVKQFANPLVLVLMGGHGDATARARRSAHPVPETLCA
jgi:hypothetical protein